MQVYKHFINGEYVDPIGGKWIDSIDPYTGQAWAKIPQGCAQDVDQAVKAASRAMKEGPWASMTASQRAKLMIKLADLVEKNAERLAELEVRDNGKLIAEMRGQVNYHPEWWRYYAGLADKIRGCSDADRQARYVCVYPSGTCRCGGCVDRLELSTLVHRMEV